MDGTQTSDPFSFVTAGHPFFPQLSDFKTLLNAHPVYAAIMQKMAAGKEIEVRKYISGRLRLDRSWELKSLYISFQCHDGSGPFPFSSSSFFYSAKKKRLEYYEFPQDSHLTTVSLRHYGPVKILRYVPRRRLTFYTVARGIPIVGKILRKAEIAPAFEKLNAVCSMVSGSPVTFSVASPIGMDEKNNVFFAEAKPGEIVAGLLDQDNFKHLLRVVGIIHSDIHRLPPAPCFPQPDFQTILETVMTQIAWISFMHPEQKALLNEVGNLLLLRVPSVPEKPVFCHGDFRCTQILKANDQWSVIDFDDSIHGDPYLEIGKFIAFLKYDAPLCRNSVMGSARKENEVLDQAGKAYLNGYEERSQVTLNLNRLLWYRICCEIFYLAQTVKRDLSDFVAFERDCARVRGLYEQLRYIEGRFRV
jgi:hypothetical protein